MIAYDQWVPSVEEMREKTLWTEQEIDQRLDEDAREIYNIYQTDGIYHVHTITMLYGATRVSAVLLNKIGKLNKLHPENPPLVFHEDSVMISSYGKEFRSNKDPIIKLPPQFSTFGHHVLVLEDVIDSGLTLLYLLHELAFPTKTPASIKLFAMIDKPNNRCDLGKSVKPDLSSFVLNEDLFVIGYGLDYKHYDRNLDEIIAIKKEFQK